MNLRVVAMLLSFASFGVALGQSAQALAGFSGAEWGMTPEQVIAAEGAAPPMIFQSGPFSEAYDYSGEVGGHVARVTYIFSNGKLTAARYLFTAKHQDLNDFIADYRAIEPLLKKTFGGPVSENAGSVGNLRLYTEWSDGRITATHSLTGANGVITHQIEYRRVAE